LKRKIIITDDGSSSLELLDAKEQYHSSFGAIQEAQFVYIKNGLNYIFSKFENNNNIVILEMGFGTGLNAFLSYLFAKENHINIDYTGIEAYPLNADEISQLNYIEQLNVKQDGEVFTEFHSLKQNKIVQLKPNFSLIKYFKKLETIKINSRFNLIYFDAFGPAIQPELWTESIFKKMFEVMLPQGVLVTYSAKGQVRRNMQQIGFIVERLPGPPGKREMLRATKP